MPADSPRMPACPTCGKPVEAPDANRWFPFCSARCKDVDLARWLGGTYRIPDRGPENGGGRPPPDEE